jgi:hypothetical protein
LPIAAFQVTMRELLVALGSDRYCRAQPRRASIYLIFRQFCAAWQQGIAARNWGLEVPKHHTQVAGTSGNARLEFIDRRGNVPCFAARVAGFGFT